MKYIHDSPIGAHGHLRSDVCLIDSRWVLKVSDVGMSWLRNAGKYSAKEPSDEADYKGITTLQRYNHTTSRINNKFA